MKLPEKHANLLLDGNMLMLRRRITVFARIGACLALAVAAFGCSTPVLDQARTAYYNNNPQVGLDALEDAAIPDRDRILYLMERGTLHQLNGDYHKSQSDYNEANSLLTQMDTLSVSRGVGSMIASDNILNFYGYPFERTYLHVMAALTYMAESDWQGAGVEARRIINSTKTSVLLDFPDDAFSHYLAGLCLEFVDDFSNARVQYRKASSLSSVLDVTDYGFLVNEGTINLEDSTTQPPPPMKGQAYIVCIVLLDRIADYSIAYPSQSKVTPVVEFSSNGKVLGTAPTIVDLGHLSSKSESELILKKAAKTGTRVAAKMVAVDQVADENGLLGFMLYLLLFSLEQPDYRHWETLPKFINLARFPCPADIKTLDVSVKNCRGEPKRSIKVTESIRRSGLLLMTFERGF